MSTWDLIVTTRRFHHRIEVAMDQALNEMGLSFAQYRILELLERGRPVHVSEIARRIRVTRQAAQASVAKLRRGGLVDIETDGYLKFVSISGSGRRRIDHCRVAAGSILRGIEAALDLHERADLAELMNRADRAVIPPDSPTWWLD